MSLKINNPSIARVENSFKQLAAASQALNHASEDMGKVIRHLDASLKKLGLGIPAWVQVSGTADDTQFTTSELGYDKVDGKWGIALRETIGYVLDHSDEHEQTWAFNDGPRQLRTDAIDKIPDLLEKMLQQTEETTRTLNEKTEQAAELTFLVSNLVPTPSAPAPQSWPRPNNEKGGQGGEFPAPARFREQDNKPASMPSPAPTGGPTVLSPNQVPNGRFRETEPVSAERPAGPARTLPAERVL